MITAFSRVQQAVYFRKIVPHTTTATTATTRRSIHAESTSEPLLPAPPNASDWNPTHLDMSFDRKQASSILYSPVLGKQPLTTVNQQQQQQQTVEESTELVIAQDIIEHDQQRRGVPATLNDSHLFDTYEQVTHLQAWGGFSRGQAKAVMETIQNLLRIRYLFIYLVFGKEKTTTIYIPPPSIIPLFSIPPSPY